MKKALPNSFSAFLQANGKFIGEAKTKGELYQIAHYPGIVEGNGFVFGELWELNNSIVSLKVLDEYEGFDEQNHYRSQYLRKQKSVILLENEHAYDCWIYYYNRSITSKRKYLDGRFTAKKP